MSRFRRIKLWIKAEIISPGYHWRQRKLRNALRAALGREPSPGDMFAGMCGCMGADDPIFQNAMRDAVREVTGEEW